MDVLKPVLGVVRGFGWSVAAELLDLYDWATGRDDEFQRWLAEHPGVVVHKIEDIQADTHERNPHPFD